MPRTKEELIVIDRSNFKAARKHIKMVFTEFKKQKTKVLLSAYYKWYKAHNKLTSTGLTEFELNSTKNIKHRNSAKKIGETYGDKYAIILTEFICENYTDEYELIEIAKEQVELAKFEGQKNPGLVPLFSKLEIAMIKDVFKLVRSSSGKVIVIKTKFEIAETLKTKNLAQLNCRDSKNSESALRSARKASTFSESFDKPSTFISKTKKDHVRNEAKSIESTNNAVYSSSEFVFRELNIAMKSLGLSIDKAKTKNNS